MTFHHVAGRGQQDFRRAQASREGSMLFLYTDREQTMAALRAETRPDDLAAFDEARKLLGLDHVRGVAATVARAGEDLLVTLRARVDAGKHPLWPMLRTPPLGRDAFSFVPEGSLAFVAATVAEGEERWKRFRSAIAPFVDGLPAGSGGSEVRSALAFLDRDLGLDFGKEILGELRAVVWALPDRLFFPPELSYSVSLEFRDGDAAAPRVERFLAALARRLLGPGAPVEFRDGAAMGAVTVRSFEPSPGRRIAYAREGSTFLLSPLAPVVLAAAEARASGRTAARSLVPALASKALVVRPSALPRTGGPDGSAQRALGNFPRVVLFTEESSDGFALQLRIPDIGRAVRESLKELLLRPAPGAGPRTDPDGRAPGGEAAPEGGPGAARGETPTG